MLELLGLILAPAAALARAIEPSQRFSPYSPFSPLDVTPAATTMTYIYLYPRRGDAGPTEAQAAADFNKDRIFSLSCMFVQVVIDTFLCGIFTMMLYTYWRWQKDRWWTRGVVVVTTVMAYILTGKSASTYILWFIQFLFVEHFGTFAPFYETAHLSWFPLLDSLMSAAVQGFFTYRAFRLNNNNWLIVVILVCLILASFAGALWTKILFAQFNSLLEAPKVMAPMLLWLVCIMAADIVITIAVLTGLLRRRTGWAHTDKVVSRLVRMTFESQAPPMIMAVIFVIEFVVNPASLFGSTLQGIQSKFYAIGLVYTLNARMNFTPTNVTMANTPGVQQATIAVNLETDTVDEYAPQAYSYAEPQYTHYGDTSSIKSSTTRKPSAHSEAERGEAGEEKDVYVIGEDENEDGRRARELERAERERARQRSVYADALEGPSESQKNLVPRAQGNEDRLSPGVHHT